MFVGGGFLIASGIASVLNLLVDVVGVQGRDGGGVLVGLTTFNIRGTGAGVGCITGTA